ncbi:MAG: hypothetical protein A3G18_11270 [Rhodospirillales bacterium RIFCSPLOWO2_12_FULL_58_28]|nr:MAG: hypothetical protein A3H92_10415 [Rhodospirillales bacterium RIFCSPLOWO2_02_FULL_58_16]OHC77772.1 MAG: hypothetical protein A3G18_11270 [Rhodospirillales bacterium RIFCSPLOWO2_12_FULL_58_28]
MSKAIKIFSGIVVVLVGVAVAGVAILRSMDFNQYRGLIAEKTKEFTGRDLVIAGDLKLEISLNPALAVEGVTFANAPWGSRPSMVSIRRLAAEVQLLPLLSDKLVVDRLVLEGLDLLAETDAKGHGNWVFGAAKPEEGGKKAAEAGAEGSGILPVVRKVHIRNVNIAYNDGQTGATTKLALDSLELDAAGVDSPLRVSLNGAFNGAAYKVSGQTGSIASLMEGGKNFSVSLKAEALGAMLGIDGVVADLFRVKGLDISVSIRGNELADAVKAVQTIVAVPAIKDIFLPAVGPYDVSSRISGSLDKIAASDIKVSVGKAEQVLAIVDGKVADPLNAKGISLNFAVEGKDIAPFAETAGGRLPALPPFRISGLLSDGAGGYAVDGLKLDIGGSDLSGKLAVALGGARPGINADLASNLLDLDKLLLKSGEQPAPTPKADNGDGRVFADDPLPLEGLKAADVDIKFKGKRIIVQGIDAADVAVAISLVNGRLEVKPFTLTAGGGRIGGDMLLDAGKPVPPLALRVEAKQIDYGALLEKSGRNDVAAGTLDLDIDVKGAGASVRALMAGLGGKTRIVAEGGRIKSGMFNIVSANVLSALPFIDSKGDKDIKCGVIDFLITSGQASARTIVFETGGLSLIGKGGVNLAGETLDLHFDPRAKKVSLMKLAMLPFDVGGSIASPTVLPNVGGAAVGVVTGAVSTATGIVSGGIKALGSAVGASSSPQEDDTDYCHLALTGKPLTARESSAPPPQPQRQNIVEDVAKGVAEGAGGIIKGIGGFLSGGQAP